MKNIKFVVKVNRRGTRAPRMRKPLSRCTQLPTRTTVADVEAFYRDMSAKGVLFSMPPKKQDFGGVLAQFRRFRGRTLQRGGRGGVGITMTDEIVFHHGTTMARRLRLALGEAMPWHRDPFHRVAVVLGGDLLSIEYGDGGERQRVEIAPGQVEWEEPSARVHRAMNIGKLPYEQVTVFLLDRPDAVAQPTEEQVSSLNNPRGAI